MAPKLKVLLTGATGRVGSILRREWGDRFELRLADIRELGDTSLRFRGVDEADDRELGSPELAPHESYVQCDTSDYGQLLSACEGMDVLVSRSPYPAPHPPPHQPGSTTPPALTSPVGAQVHLAADPNPGADWETSLLPRNVIGCYNGFAAAHEAGLSRIVFASSVNAVNGWAEEDWTADEGVSADVPVWPVNVYGAAKCFGEALGRVYSTSHGLSAICVRFGSPEFTQDPDGARQCFQCKCTRNLSSPQTSLKEAAAQTASRLRILRRTTSGFPHATQASSSAAASRRRPTSISPSCTV